MAGANLLALIDDIATLLDDVSIMTKVAAKKTAGVLGDDLAVNAEQVSGVKPDRELPVVWAVFKGSMRNKLILVPAALLISAFLPWAITPLLMLGGAYLCYEGFEKIAHHFSHHKTQKKQELVAAVANPNIDLVAFEKNKIQGAVRTDFILSAEIIAITLGIVAGSPMTQQIVVLSVVAVGMTMGVYGFVAGIVKLDDLGLYLSHKKPPWRQLGVFLVRAAPYLMKLLSVLGTAAMFLVGGGIIVHGVPALEHFNAELNQSWGHWGKVFSHLAPAILGVAIGALTLLAVSLLQKLRGTKH